MKAENKNLFFLMSLSSLYLMFCLPFLVSYHKSPETTFYGQALAFTLGVLSLIALFKPSKTGLAFPPTVLVPIALILLLGVQWFSGIGVFWQETTLGVLYLSWAIMLMLTVTHLKQIYSLETLVTWLAYALLLGGLFNVLVVLMQLIDADQFFWTFALQGTSYTGNLAQVNLLSDYLSLAMTSILYLHLKGKVKASTVYIVVFILLIALSLTGSRMSWLYVLMISISFFIFGRANEQAIWRDKAKYILLLPFIFGLIQFCLPLILAGLIPPTPAARLAEMAGQPSVRLSFIKEALDIAQHHLWFGVGWGQFVWYDLIFADTYTMHTGFTSHTHNLFVQILVECGVFALLALFIGCVYWLIQLLKQQNTLERWWLLLISGIIFVHSMLEYPLWYAYFLGVLVVVVALADKSISVSAIKPIFIKTGAGITMVAAISLIGVTTYQYKQVEYWVKNFSKFNDKQSIAMLNEMTALQQRTLVAESVHLILTRAYSILPSKNAPTAEKIAKYESVLHYIQAEEDVYRYVLLLATDGRMQQASAYLTRAYNRHPGFAQDFAKQLEKLLSKPANRKNPQLLALQKQLKQLQQADR